MLLRVEMSLERVEKKKLTQDENFDNLRKFAKTSHAAERYSKRLKLSR